MNENFKSSYTNYNHEEFMLLPSDSTFSRCSLIQICLEFINFKIFLYVLSRSKDIRLCTFIHWDDKCAPFRCSKTYQGYHYWMYFKYSSSMILLSSSTWIDLCESSKIDYCQNCFPNLFSYIHILLPIEHVINE